MNGLESPPSRRVAASAGRVVRSVLRDDRVQIRNLAPDHVETRIRSHGAAMPHREGVVPGGHELPEPAACLLESHRGGVPGPDSVGQMASICTSWNHIDAAGQTLRASRSRGSSALGARRGAAAHGAAADHSRMDARLRNCDGRGLAPSAGTGRIAWCRSRAVSRGRGAHAQGRRRTRGPRRASDRTRTKNQA
jgi:hypothetical protein